MTSSQKKNNKLSYTVVCGFDYLQYKKTKPKNKKNKMEIFHCENITIIPNTSEKDQTTVNL